MGGAMRANRWLSTDIPLDAVSWNSDILIRSENDLAQFAATATSMNGAFFLVSGLWLLGPMVPNHFPIGKRSGLENKAPDQDLWI